MMPMESRLSLRCLGEPVLSGPDGEPIRFKVRKHLALLVFLAVEARSRHDLDRLETGDVLASELQPALDIAGFLDGLEVPGAAEFMLWRERQRSRWLPLVR